MRVLIISHEYPYRGNEIRATFVNEQVEELARQGCEVKVISPVPWAPFPLNKLSSKWWEYSNILRKDIFNGIEVYYPRAVTFPRNIFHEWSGKLVYAGIRRTVRELVKEGYDFDVIHAHHAFPNGYAGLLLSEEYKKPLIVTVHGMDLQNTIHHNRLCFDAIKQVLEGANQVITVSSKLQRLAHTIGISAKIVVVGNGIPDAMIHKSHACKIEEDLIMVSVSNLIITKGLDYNLKAVAALRTKFPNLQYHIVGSGPEQQNLINLTEELGISAQVSFLGALSHEDVFKKMANCQIFSLPSWSEGFGVVYIEAMSQGKPIIACQGEGIEDVIQRGVNGMLVSPKDVDSLVKAIDFLISYPVEANQIGQRGRETVMKDYTWGKIVQNLIKIYAQHIK
jgi:teichuronic acid biosynthesis glycosyltransferase TuaC